MAHKDLLHEAHHIEEQAREAPLSFIARGKDANTKTHEQQNNFAQTVANSVLLDATTAQIGVQLEQTTSINNLTAAIESASKSSTRLALALLAFTAINVCVAIASAANWWIF